MPVRTLLVCNCMQRLIQTGIILSRRHSWAIHTANIFYLQPVNNLHFKRSLCFSTKDLTFLWVAPAAFLHTVTEKHQNKCAHELNMTSLSEWWKWARGAEGSWGFCTLTPASIQIKRWQKAVGVGSRAPLIKPWSWLLQDAAISHWSLGTVCKSHMGLRLSMSIIACVQGHSKGRICHRLRKTVGPYTFLKKIIWRFQSLQLWLWRKFMH